VEFLHVGDAGGLRGHREAHVREHDDDRYEVQRARLPAGVHARQQGDAVDAVVHGFDFLEVDVEDG